VSLANDGSEPNDASFVPAISGDGRYVVFTSQADNLVGTDRNSAADIFLRDTCIGATSECRPSTMLISASADESADEASAPALAAEGRYVDFVSASSHLVPDDANQRTDAFVHDTCMASTACIKATWRLSRGRLGVEADADILALALTPDGRALAFTSTASNLVPGDTNGAKDVFVISAREDGPDF